MVDSHLTVSDRNLRTHFAQKAVLPQREASEAATFVATLEQQLAKGHKPTTSEVKTGTSLLDDLEAKKTRFEFSFAQVIASDAGDIDSRVEEIGASLGKIESTANRLREVLGKLG